MLKVICLFAGANREISVLFLLMFFILGACSKDDRLPFKEEPEITLLNLSHDTIRQYEDVLVIRIRYLDGDGDLGFEEPDRYALFVRDARLEDFDDFFIGPVAPPGELVPVQGEIDIELPSLFLFGNGDLESTYFEIKMVDRAGNESNLITTRPVIISRN